MKLKLLKTLKDAPITINGKTLKIDISNVLIILENQDLLMQNELTEITDYYKEIITLERKHNKSLSKAKFLTIIENILEHISKEINLNKDRLLETEIAELSGNFLKNIILDYLTVNEIPKSRQTMIELLKVINIEACHKLGITIKNEP